MQSSPRSKVSWRWLVLPLLVLAYPADAQAYIDPGTGSLIVNLLAFVMGGFFAFRSHLRRLKDRLFGGSSQPEPERDGEPSPPPKS
jgi:hypothetical protein